MSKKIFSLVLCILLMPVFLSAKTVEADLTAKTQGNAIVRSILIPGWGQLFQGKKTKGYIILFGAIVSAGVAYYYYYQADKAYDKYKTIGLVSDSSYQDYVNNSNNSQYALLSLGVFWLYGIVDTYFFSSKNNQEGASLNKREGLRLAFDKRDLKLVFSKSF